MIKKSVILLLSTFAFAFIIIPSCTFDKVAVDFADVGICFQTEILPIFVSNCTGSGCHNSTDREEGYDLTNYNGIMKGIIAFDANGSEHIKSILDSDPDDVMPPPPASPLSATQISLLTEWINKGAPNTANCETGACDSLVNLSFATEVMPIIQTNCAGGGCHDVTAAGGYDYTSYSGVKSSVDNSRMMGTINHQSGFSAMPPSYQISSCDNKTIETWISEGALNN
ncbi:MAG: c-type cytochrome domain-containing protein [Saprospiraceae bacterium]